jgi:hypothetical protein
MERLIRTVTNPEHPIYWYTILLALPVLIVLYNALPGIAVRAFQPNVVDRGILNNLLLVPLGRNYRARCTTEKEVGYTTNDRSIILLGLNDQDAALAAPIYLNCPLIELSLLRSRRGLPTGRGRSVKIPDPNDYRGLVLPP